MNIAKYASTCDVCNKPIVPRRDKIRKLGPTWVHIVCYSKYYDDITSQIQFEGSIGDFDLHGGW